MNGKNVYITGHSLGGHLSMDLYRQIIAQNNNYSVIKAETFNPVGMGSNVSFGELGRLFHNQTCCDVAKKASEFMGLQYPGIPNPTVKVKSHDICLSPKRDGNWWQKAWGNTNMVLSWVDAHDMKHFNAQTVKRKIW
jgi:hypothetical protein